MTRYTVVWHDDAQNQLAQIWLDASSRGDVASAADTIDRALSRDPEMKGIEVEGGLRQLLAPPLQALFFVSEQDRIVKILDVSPA